MNLAADNHPARIVIPLWAELAGFTVLVSDNAAAYQGSTEKGELGWADPSHCGNRQPAPPYEALAARRELAQLLRSAMRSMNGG
mmetsp:Transcript_11009/g.24269  ORF Transcript_11009/g.24269 Transcript_11009/m.24269 type:complete len:84 (+) Transcript_11009:1-252(+)